MAGIRAIRQVANAQKARGRWPMPGVIPQRLSLHAVKALRISPFLYGMSYVLDLGFTQPLIVLPEQRPTEDREALACDWEMVGRTLNGALRHDPKYAD